MECVKTLILLSALALMVNANIVQAETGGESDSQILMFKDNLDRQPPKLYVFDLKTREYTIFSDKDYFNYSRPSYDPVENRVFFQSQYGIYYLKNNEIFTILELEPNKRIYRYCYDSINQILYYTKGKSMEEYKLYKYDLKTGQEEFIASANIDYLSEFTTNGEKIAYNGKDGSIYLANTSDYIFNPILKGAVGAVPSLEPGGSRIAYGNSKDYLCVYDLNTQKNRKYNVKNVGRIIWLNKDNLFYSYGYRPFYGIQGVTRLGMVNLETNKVTVLEKKNVFMTSGYCKYK